MASYEQNRSAVVTAARSGGMSRRGFLSAMLALGVDAPEAARELAPKLIEIARKILREHADVFRALAER